jgi:hypothetical protein
MGGVSRHWPCETGASSLEVGFEQVVGAESAGAWARSCWMVGLQPVALNTFTAKTKADSRLWLLYLPSEENQNDWLRLQSVRPSFSPSWCIDYNILPVSVRFIINIRLILRKS